MGISDLPANDATQPATSGRRLLLLATFTTAIFVSAALLFMVQPMFTKMVLPRLGGAPSVWSVAIVFFQGALLAGYAYAHWLTRYAPGRASVVIHVVVTIGAVFALPLSIAAGWARPPESGEALWLMGLFTASIGLPFFALAANSPLLQAWFARTDHPAADDPYFLYGASNIGSFLALVSYPSVIEPFVGLKDQAELWSLGFGLLIALLVACGALLWRSPEKSAQRAAADAADPPPSWRDAAFWVALAAVPSGLLVAVTAHISTDVAAVPLLWVLPLALYLLTFVIVFARRPIIPHRLVVAVQPLFIIGLVAVLIFDPLKTIIGLVAVHLAVFFVNALMCHGELARTRPPPQHLTASCSGRRCSTGPSPYCWSQAHCSGGRRCRSPPWSRSSCSPTTTSSSRQAPCRCAASSASPRSRRPPTASSACCSTGPRCTAASASASSTATHPPIRPNC